MITAIPFAGGLALFLLSLTGMSRALGEVLSPRTRTVLTGASVPAAFAFGAGATALLQSSTLVSVTLVGLVSARAMGLAPAFAAVLGANVGTTITAQIAGFRPTWLGWIAAVAGLLLVGWARAAARMRGGKALRARARQQSLAGGAAMGFGGVVLGLDLMGQACSAVADSNTIRLVLTMASGNTVLAAFAGVAVTAAVQSSALVSSLLVELTSGGLIALPGAVAMMIGSNVGTCITALLASVPAGDDAKALARANIIFNLVGAGIFLPLIGPVCQALRLTSPDSGVQLANAHTLFNLATALLVLPFSRQFVAAVRGRRNQKERFNHDYAAGNYARNRARPN
ncbi:MAG: Na/Pi symporter [Clostridia bacterium]|nr:Na/Pi symporter [Clostridia bacterium]